MGTISYGVSGSGTLEKCRAKPENRGKGRCTHGDHIEVSQSQVDNGEIDKFNEKIEEANAIKQGLGVSGNSLQKKTTTRKPTSKRITEEIVESGRVNLLYRKKPGAHFEIPSAKEAEGYMGSSGWIGGNSADKYRPLKEIAKDIRLDIKKAIDAGMLPANAKYSVTSKDNSINISTYIPGVKSYEIGQYTKDGMYPSFTKNAELIEVQKQLQMISDSYNYDQSNSQVDYFNRGFYGRASFVGENERDYEKVEKARRELGKYVQSELDKEVSADSIRQSEKYHSLRSNFVAEQINGDNNRRIESELYEECKKLNDLQKLSPEKVDEIIERNGTTREIIDAYEAKVDEKLMKPKRIRLR